MYLNHSWNLTIALCWSLTIAVCAFYYSPQLNVDFITLGDAVAPSSSLARPSLSPSLSLFFFFPPLLGLSTPSSLSPLSVTDDLSTTAALFTSPSGAISSFSLLLSSFISFVSSGHFLGVFFALLLLALGFLASVFLAILSLDGC